MEETQTAPEQQEQQQPEQRQLPNPQMQNPNGQQPQMPQHTQYDKIFDRSLTAIGSSFFLKGRETSGKSWELRNKLEMAYEKHVDIPRFDRISFYDLLK
jgi:hypothetical protein